MEVNNEVVTIIERRVPEIFLRIIIEGVSGRSCDENAVDLCFSGPLNLNEVLSCPSDGFDAVDRASSALEKFPSALNKMSCVSELLLIDTIRSV